MKSVLVFSIVLLAASQACAVDVDEEVNQYAESECPALLEAQAGAFAVRNISFNSGQVKEICACAGKAIREMAGTYTPPPTQDEWSEIGGQAMKQCLKQPMADGMTQSCMQNEKWRSSGKMQYGLSDRQFDQFCACHFNLIFDEAVKGQNPSDPHTRQILQDKSVKVCLRPMVEANANASRKDKSAQ